MIVPEWRRILEGRESFVDKEAEQVAKFLLEEIRQEQDVGRLIELMNDLEWVMGSVEWLTRKYERLAQRLKEEVLPKEEVEFLREKISRVRARRNEVLEKVKRKYGL